MHHSKALQDLHNQQSIIKDRIRGVVAGHATGMYLHGRPGSSKTYLVKTTLEQLAVGYALSTGHLTPVGLFNLLAGNPQGIIVLDDVTAIFQQPAALQILLAALGKSHNGSRVRSVHHQTAKGNMVVHFQGGVIAISNLPLAGHHHRVLDALNDRVQVVAYDPTDEQLKDHILQIAAGGPKDVSAKDAIMVAKFTVSEAAKVGQRPSLRMFMDKALEDFKLWKSGLSETHWKDLIRSSVQQQVVAPEMALRDVSRRERVGAEQRVAQEIYLTYPTHDERTAAWKEKMRSSASSFNRRISELRKLGTLIERDSDAA